MKTNPPALALAALLCMLPIGSPALADGEHGFCRIGGAWLTDVNFPPPPPGVPPGPPPFKSLITFHAGGTVSETNTTLHANSAVPGSFNFNGSEAYGGWRRAPGRCAIEYVTLKLVFDGTTNQHVGYLRVRARLEVERNQIASDPGESYVELLIGPDPDAPFETIPFGGAEVSGKRVR